ncbi:MAG: isoaspartyl peptidase/L-asparaginase family protein [Rhodothermaceae bacterium]
MKKILIAVLVLTCLSLVSCTREVKSQVSETKVADFGLVIHGGAGNIVKERFSPEKKTEYEQKLEEALNTGYEILKNGGASLDAVQATINVLEDSPLFNAGKGAVFSAEERNELDASIMDGKTLNAGAVAGVMHTRNPVNLARLVMDSSKHVMMVGAGAEEFGKQFDIEFVDTEYFKTEKSWKALQRAKAKEKSLNEKMGTVGCVALDKNGNLAAGTSTGGMTNKKFKRVGDSPIIGAGTYANNNTCAVSATGHGEFFIRNCVTHDISALMEYKNLSLKDAADKVIMKKLKNQGGNGGIVAIDKNGNVAMTFNTPGMFRGFRLSGKKAVVKLFAE